MAVSPARSRLPSWGRSETIAALLVVLVLAGGAAAWRYGTPALSENLRARAESTSSDTHDGVAVVVPQGGIRVILPEDPILVFLQDPEFRGRFAGTLYMSGSGGSGTVILARVERSGSQGLESLSDSARTMIPLVLRTVGAPVPEFEEPAPIRVGGRTGVDLRGVVSPADGSEPLLVRGTIVARGQLLIALVGIGAEDALAEALETLSIGR